MKTILFSLMLFVASKGATFAQLLNIEPYLSRVEKGDAAGVQAELPTLMNQYPSSPEVLYLQAVLTTDGAEAVRLYQNLVDNFPKSEWADDALFKVYKFYQAIGLNSTAEIKLSQLRANYPDSKFVNEGIARSESGESPKVHEQPPATTPSVVETPKVPEAKRSEVSAPTPEHLAKYTLQVGVYSSRSNANKQKAFFEYQNLAAEIVSKFVGSRELFAVFVGGYATAEEARAKGDEIKNTFNVDYLVVTR